MFIAFDKIEECNYERAEELCESLSAEPLPVYKYPNILGAVNMRGHAENIMWSGFTPSSSSTSLCYVKEDGAFTTVDYNKANTATAIPCRIVIGERYLSRAYSKLQEVEFSTSENVGNKKRIEDCEEIRLTLYRNLDGAVVKNVSASVGNNGHISLLHMFPHGNEVVGVEYSVEYQLIDDINIGTYYETWIDEVNTYGTAIASEFTLTINTI